MLDRNDDAFRSKWRQILSRHVLQEFGSRRIAQLFEIIKEFPDRYRAMLAMFCCVWLPLCWTTDVCGVVCQHLKTCASV